MRIDLNADVGESFGAWTLGDDAGVLDVVTSANVACGFHAGDPLTLRTTCRDAARRGVVVGLPGSVLLEAAADAGLPVVREAFADRAYTRDGRLVPRSEPGSVLHDPDAVAERVLHLVRDGVVRSVD